MIDWDKVKILSDEEWAQHEEADRLRNEYGFDITNALQNADMSEEKDEDVKDPGLNHSSNQSASESTQQKKKRRITLRKKDNVDLIAIKEEYDRLLNAYKKETQFNGVAVNENKMKPHRVRAFKSANLNLGKKRITLKDIDGEPILITEAAVVSDYGNHLNYALKDCTTPAQKITLLNGFKTITPTYVACQNKTIPSDILDHARSKRTFSN